MAMLNSGIVDVGIALIYVFVLVSVLVSAVNELFAGLLKQRAKALHQGLGELLQSSDLRDALYTHPLIVTLSPPTSRFANLLPARVRPIVKGGAQPAASPSYIPKDACSAALIDLLGGTKVAAVVREVDEILRSTKDGATPSPELATEIESVATAAKQAGVAQEVVDGLSTIATAIRGGAVADLRSRLEPVGRALGLQLTSVMITNAQSGAKGVSPALADVVRLLAADAPASVEQVRRALEGWFDAGMERVAGWYKRWTQLWQLGIGLVIAAALNIDVAAIGVALWNDVPLRSAIVADAEKFAQNPPPGLFAAEPARGNGDPLDVQVAPPLLNDKDPVRVGVVLPTTRQQPVKVKLVGTGIELSSSDLVIKAGEKSATIEGKVEHLPIEVTIEATIENEPPISRTVLVPSSASTRIARAREMLGSMLPIGWPTSSFEEWYAFFRWSMIPGWFLTAIGASFGAPFWFDLLNRIVQLRSGGRKPDGQGKTQPT